MILIFTDFGYEGPYVGQMRTVLAQRAPAVPAIDLMHDAPTTDERASAYLLAALLPESPPGAALLCVVDPGVGGARAPVVAEIDGRVLIGPGNGLFEPALRRARAARQWRIDWRPERLSKSFHGRDLFAPVAADIARAGRVTAALEAAFSLTPLDAGEARRPDWPDELSEIVYIDHYGNAMTGVRASAVAPGAAVRVGKHLLRRLSTFSDAAPGAPFCYENSSGLLEVAVNRGSAAEMFDLAIGAPVDIVGAEG